MRFYCSEKFLNYEMGNIFRLFFPYEKLEVVNENIENSDISVDVIGENINICVNILNKNINISVKCENTNAGKEHTACSEIFKIFAKITEYKPNWGMLTGIHPVKLYSTHIKTSGEKLAEKTFLDDFFVKEEKLELCKQIRQAEKNIIEDIKEDDFSLYVSIPFCPSRCSYCSFVSQSTEKTDKLIAPYLELLLQEIEYTANVVKTNKLILKSVYIGGGTPTSLNAEQLKILINKIKNSFNMETCMEFTVEAGRPDTLNEDKLNALKECEIKRISINPQTLNDEVLEAIGRRHSAQDFLDKYKLARKIGFETINTDLIAGLEKDTFESFKKTLDEIIELSPENITVHSLSLKRSATIFREENTESYHSDIQKMEKMINYSIKSLTDAGYIPYYLYRQSRMAGNAENTGWAKPNHVCAYNIYTMDESQTVIACGAGGVSKLKDPYSTRLERIFNFKYPYEYIDRFEQIKSRKDEVSVIYEQFRKRLY